MQAKVRPSPGVAVLKVGIRTCRQAGIAEQVSRVGGSGLALRAVGTDALANWTERVAEGAVVSIEEIKTGAWIVAGECQPSGGRWAGGAVGAGLGAGEAVDAAGQTLMDGRISEGGEVAGCGAGGVGGVCAIKESLIRGCSSAGRAVITYQWTNRTGGQALQALPSCRCFSVVGQADRVTGCVAQPAWIHARRAVALGYPETVQTERITNCASAIRQEVGTRTGGVAGAVEQSIAGWTSGAYDVGRADVAVGRAGVANMSGDIFTSRVGAGNKALIAV